MPTKRGRGISLTPGSLRTCPVCRRPRGVVRGEFVGHVDGNGQPCPGSGRPAASRSGGEGLPARAGRE